MKLYNSCVSSMSILLINQIDLSYIEEICGVEREKVENHLLAIHKGFKNSASFYKEEVHNMTFIVKLLL